MHMSKRHVVSIVLIPRSVKFEINVINFILMSLSVFTFGLQKFSTLKYSVFVKNILINPIAGLNLQG